MDVDGALQRAVHEALLEADQGARRIHHLDGHCLACRGVCCSADATGSSELSIIRGSSFGADGLKERGERASANLGAQLVPRAKQRAAHHCVRPRRFGYILWAVRLIAPHFFCASSRDSQGYEQVGLRALGEHPGPASPRVGPHRSPPTAGAIPARSDYLIWRIDRSDRRSGTPSSSLHPSHTINNPAIWTFTRAGRRRSRCFAAPWPVTRPQRSPCAAARGTRLPQPGSKAWQAAASWQVSWPGCSRRFRCLPRPCRSRLPSWPPPRARRCSALHPPMQLGQLPLLPPPPPPPPPLPPASLAAWQATTRHDQRQACRRTR